MNADKMDNRQFMAPGEKWRRFFTSQAQWYGMVAQRAATVGGAGGAAKPTPCIIIRRRNQSV